ncbi:MAG: hypothetical protein ACE5D3_05510 [Candidatus Binatia bacterium]
MENYVSTGDRMRYFLALLILACGCTMSDIYVAADKATYDAVAPEYRAYVEADDSLDSEQKKRRARTLKAWETRIAEGVK